MNREKFGQSLNRRQFIQTAALAAAAPLILPSRVFGAGDEVAPSERIAIGCIGVGRMGVGDLKELIKYPPVQIVAVCDVDAHRAKAAQNAVEKHYAKERGSGKYKGCGIHHEFEELLARSDIDAVSIVTPDHWHAIPAIAAAKAGKDIFLQKPLTLTIAEGRALSDAVRKHQRVFQTGSQQRSESNFRFACELARNGRLGKLQTVKVGFGTDPTCGLEPEMPVPKWLDYNRWLGQAPEKPYTENRVHPQEGYDRPGWLRIRDYGSGMMTGWGSHHLDIAQWGMGAEYSGPVEITGKGEFPDPKEHLWDVHGAFNIDYTYANGVRVNCADTNTGGIRFEGTEGWVWVTRGEIKAEPASLLTTEIGPNEIHLYKSNDHKGNFLDCIKTRAETVAPVEIAHRSCTTCILGEIAMRLGRTLKWDPGKEQFVNDPEADKERSRVMRAPWTLG